MAAEDGEVGFEEGMLWLPTHVLNEACDTKARLRFQQRQHQHRYHYHHYHLKSPTEPLPMDLKSSSRPHHRPKLVPKFNWPSGGPGMQAIFLESGQRSCGTGVFLPQRTGTNSSKPSNKPACSPVLLPSRVVRALNLNVHTIGLQMSPRQDTKTKPNVRNRNSSINKNAKDLQTQCCVISQNQSSSPETFLPKEWTY